MSTAVPSIPLSPPTLSSIALPKAMAIICFKVLYDVMRFGKQESTEHEESGCQEESLIGHAENRITLKSAGNSKGPLGKPPPVTETMAQWMDSLRTIEGDGKGYSEFIHSVGFCDRLEILLGGSWSSLPEFGRLSDLLTSAVVKFLGINRTLVYDWKSAIDVYVCIQETFQCKSVLSCIDKFPNRQCGSKNIPFAITAKPKLAVQSLRKFPKECPLNTSILNPIDSFNSKVSWACWDEPKGTVFIEESNLHYSQGDFKRETLQTYSSGEMSLEQRWKYVELLKEKKFLPDSYLALTPLGTPASEDSRSPPEKEGKGQTLTDLPAEDEPISKLGLSWSLLPTEPFSIEETLPEKKFLPYSYLVSTPPGTPASEDSRSPPEKEGKGQTLTDLTAEDEPISKLGLSWSLLPTEPFSIKETLPEKKFLPYSYLGLTPPGTPASEDSRSPPEKDAKGQTLTDLPAEDEPISELGSPFSLLPIELFSCELTPPDSPARQESPPGSPRPILVPSDVQSFEDLYWNNEQPLLASYSQFSSALKHFDSCVFPPKPDDCGWPEGNSKLFGTWTNMIEDSGDFIGKFQHGFQGTEDCYLKMTEKFLGRVFKISR